MLRTVLLAVVIATVATGCSGGSKRPAAPGSSGAPSATTSAFATFDIKGQVLMPVADTEMLNPGGIACSGTGKFQPMVAGSQIVITGPTGQTVATGKLGPAVLFDKGCGFNFTVDAIPVLSGYYGVKFAGQDPQQLNQEQLQGVPTHGALEIDLA